MSVRGKTMERIRSPFRTIISKRKMMNKSKKQKLKKVARTQNNAAQQVRSQIQGLGAQRTVRRVLHVQVAGQPSREELQAVAEQFATMINAPQDGVITTPANVQAYNINVESDNPITGIVVQPTLTIYDIARTAYEVNRGYARSLDEDVPSWEEATEAA